ncbi:MAG: hypothetical protein E6K54_08760 [Gammaproteobacteria bacterium]|nr:MAG: hypothetical protein E6K54_08760 [Gammaproteobacteria bacterium]
MCKPNAKLIDIIPSKESIQPGQCVVILAGTNDISSGESRNLYKTFNKTLEELSDYQLIIPTIPLRHDLSLKHNINEEIFLLNEYLKELSLNKKNMHLIDLNYISRNKFTRHGLHFNFRGKVQLSKLISDKVLGINFPDINKRNSTNENTLKTDYKTLQTMSYSEALAVTSDEWTCEEKPRSKTKMLYSNNSKINCQSNNPNFLWKSQMVSNKFHVSH